MRYIIIGNGAAGNAAAGAIRGLDPAGEVLIFADEPVSSYYRPLITNLIEGRPAGEILMADAAGPPGANVRLGQQVTGLDAAASQITLQDGETVAFDRLLLATGASAILPDIPGLPGPGTFVLRTLAGAQALAQAAREAKHAVVIGAGRVGLKAALSLRHRGLPVTLVEQGPYVAPMQFDAAAGEILAQALESTGIRLCLGKTVSSVTRDGGRITGAVLADGLVLEADILIAAVGVRPNVELAGKAGLAVNQGILVDHRLRTSAPGIYAAGDVAETVDLITGQRLVSGLWTNAAEMGRLAGRNMAGAKMEYPGAFGVLNALEVAGIPTMAMGLTNPNPGEGYEVQQGRRGSSYRKLVFKEGVLVGALLLGDIEGAGVYAGFIRAKVKAKVLYDTLAHPRAGLAAWLAGSISKAKRTT